MIRFRRAPSGWNGKALAAAGLVLLLSIPVLWSLTQAHRENLLAAERERIGQELAPYRDALVRGVEKRLGLMDALRAFIRANRGERTFGAEFRSYAAGLYSGSRGIRALEIMPGGVAEYVYPLAGNERFVGHDMFQDPRPDVARDVRRTAQTDRIVVSDPIELFQGGRGIIARQSVFENSRFWGFITIVLDLPEFLREAGLGRGTPGLQLAVKDCSGRVIFGNPAVFSESPIQQSVPVTEGDWVVAAIPAAGWSMSPAAHVAWFWLAFVGMLSTLAYFIVERHTNLTLAVREGDERYRAITDAVPVVIAYVDRDGRYRFSNRASRHWFDRASGHAAGTRLRDVLGEEVYARVGNQIESALAGKQATFEMTAPASDGAVRYLKAVCVPRILGPKEHNGFYLLVTDVTDLKLAEKAAVESRDFLQRLLDDFPALVWRSGPDGGCRYFNRSWLEFTGQTLEQECFGGSVHPEDAAAKDAAYRDAFAARRPFQIEYRLRRADGEYRTVVDLAKPLTDANGNLEGYLGSCYDITDRKRAKESLRRTNRMLEAIVKGSPLAIVMLDRKGTVLSWNRAAAAMYGYSEQEAVGARLPIISEAGVPEFEGLLARVLGGEPMVAVERTRQRKDGSPIDISIWAAAIPDEDGGTSAILAIHADITARKQLEDQLRQSQKMEAIGRLAGGVAHDFNNILSVIAGYGHMLELGLPDDEQLHRDLGEILKAGERASDLTKQLLAFSRKQVVQRKVIDLNALLAGMEKMLRRLIGEDIELRILAGTGLGSIYADPGQIEQVVMNLAVNARDAMPKGGILTVEMANVRLGANGAASEMVMLAIVDTGVGMDSETLSHIFEPFFTTKERGKGTGLGLSTVYGIVKQSGGDIRVYSQPGRGATFVIYLPRIDAAATVESSVRAPLTAAGNATILLVEDENGVRKLVREVLQRAGYSVLEAANAGEALLICEQHKERIDLMLTDVVMPKMGGGELAKRLGPLRPDMRVLFMSGYMDDAIVRHGVQNSGMAFLQKPLTPGSLVRKVREVLDA